MCEKIISQKLQEEIKEIASRYDLIIEFSNNRLTKKSKKQFEETVNWRYVAVIKAISNDFIKLFYHKINWGWLLYDQQVSEEIIEEFSNKVNWDSVSHHQKLSENFILKYYNKLNFQLLLINYKISSRIKEKIKLLQRTIQL